MNPERIQKILGDTDLFGDLSEGALGRIADRCIDRSYKKGQLIFHQGDPAESMFLMVEGLVKVLVPSTEGGEMVLTTLAPPDTFGELAVLDGGTRSASAETVENTRVLALSRATLLELLHSEPHLTEVMLASLGGIIRRLTEQASDLVFLDLHGRVAKLLLHMAERGGPPQSGEIVLDLAVTQTDLARMVGGSRQTVNQILRSFEGRGYLELQGRRILLKQPDLLRRRASL
jgi:CRP-like cAMP-binding protein